jgi:hypothetical protein
MRRAVWALLLLAAVAPVSGAQQAGGTQVSSAALAPLRRGRLVVWVVKPARLRLPTPDSGTAGFTPMTYKEESASTFGRSASEFGKTAGSVGVSSTSATISRTGNVPKDTAPADVDAVAAAQAGAKEQTAGSFGQTASTFGTAASSHGETSGSFGQAAGSYGTEASNVGSTAGNFGESLSTIATAGEVKPVALAASWLATIEERLPRSFPGSRVAFVEVTTDRLDALLKRAEGTAAYPDVLVFDGFPVAWKGPAAQVRELEAGSAQEFLVSSPRRLLVLNHGLHPEVAKAFLAYLDQQGVER